MVTVKEHYNNVLSDIYSWMYGGFDKRIARNRKFFQERQIEPNSSGITIDLGSGYGFQSIPLA